MKQFLTDAHVIAMFLCCVQTRQRICVYFEKATRARPFGNVSHKRAVSKILLLFCSTLQFPSDHCSEIALVVPTHSHMKGWKKGSWPSSHVTLMAISFEGYGGLLKSFFIVYFLFCCFVLFQLLSIASIFFYFIFSILIFMIQA